MPGLFGWIDLAQDGARRAGDTAETLAEMGRRMSHTGDEVVETWTDGDRGLAIARVAPRGQRPVPWPTADGPADAPRAFVDGVLHGDAAHVAERVDDLAHR